MIELEHEDDRRLIDLLAEQAFGADDPEQYLRQLVNRSNLPRRFKMRLAAIGKGDPVVAAGKLVDFLLTKDLNPEDPRLTSLGEVLRPLLADSELGLEATGRLAGIIYRNRLFRDRDLLDRLVMAYQIPQPAAESEGEREYGPDIDWIGPEGDVELQSWLKPEPDYLDLGFLARAVERAASVCRVEFEGSGKRGTGFVVGHGKVLTNHHVVASDAEAQRALLRFGCFTLPRGGGGREAAGQTVRLDPAEPVLRSSPAGELDFALLQVAPGGKLPPPVELETGATPAKGAAIHILQHPKGQAMKLASSSNGVTAVNDGAGLVQYVTRAAGGSSGSPCFDDDWKVVALHHAERASGLVTRREGVLMRHIYDEIADHL